MVDWIAVRPAASPTDGTAAVAGAEPRIGALPILPVLLSGLLIAFCLTGVFGHSLWGANDAREGGMVLDMARNGTRVVATNNGEPYWEKPPLMFWAALLLAHVAGGVTEGVVRLPSALAGLGTLLLLYTVVARARPRRSGGVALDAWAAVFLCATAPTFLEYSRIVLTDMTLTFMVTLALWLFWWAYRKGGRAWARWVPFLAAAALAFYAKGLVGPALIWCAVGLFLVLERRFALCAGLAAAWLALAMVVVGPWVLALHRFGGVEALRAVFWNNQFGRFFTFARTPDLPADPFFVHKEGPFYYLLQVPRLLGPWTVLLVPALWDWFNPRGRYDGTFPRFVRSAVVGMLTLLQVSSAKVGVYALPVFPWLFAAGGTWLADLAAEPRRRPVAATLVDISIGSLWLILAAAPAAFLYFWWAGGDLVRVSGGLSLAPVAAALCLVEALVIGAALLSIRVRNSGVVAWPLAPAVGAILLMQLFALTAPVVDYHRNVAPVVSLARAEERAGIEVALASAESEDLGDFVFYLGHRMRVFRKDAAVDAFLADSRPRAVITRRGFYPELEAEARDGRLTALPCGGGRRARQFLLLVNRQPRSEEPRAVRGAPSA